MRYASPFRPIATFTAAILLISAARGQVATPVSFHGVGNGFALVHRRHAVTLVVESEAPLVVKHVAAAFSADVEAVSSHKPRIVSTWEQTGGGEVVLVGVVGQSPLLDRLQHSGKLDLSELKGKWESAVQQVVSNPAPGVARALVIAGSDRRGAAYALFGLSRGMGVSPWSWWADVPVPHHPEIFVTSARRVQGEPSVQYRGIFLNDEDWGLRPWAARKMDPKLGAIGPNTYEKIFELLLRLRANSLWPAMHPGTLAFNAVPQNAKLADEWAIVMGSSHSEALLRNNVGEWNEKTDGPWNYQVNRNAIDAYWRKRLEQNGEFENFYTVGMRGVHDTGLEATGSTEVKARLVEDVMRSQREILAANVLPALKPVPQVIWLYKESLELYRAGMRVPEDVTLGWTDDNFGYIRQLPTVEEQRRPGGSGVYYHVSYWGFPHDYLWLCSTPPALIQEEMTKAYDHNARRYWMLNVGDLKPAEMDIDYFMQLGWDEPGMADVGQKAFLECWFAEQFPGTNSAVIAALMNTYYKLNFLRKPEFMGFNGYNDGIQRTLFNPDAWGDQNTLRLAAWRDLNARAERLEASVPAAARAAYFELVRYPIAAAAAQNEKFLSADRSFLDATQLRDPRPDAMLAHAAYQQVQTLTSEYNHLLGGKWDGILSADPRERQVFRDPETAGPADADKPLPADWQASKTSPPLPGAGFVERDRTVSIEAAHFTRKWDGTLPTQAVGWHTLDGLGISGPAVEYGRPGKLSNQPATDWNESAAPWLEYAFTTASTGPAQLMLELLPTFPVDRQHHLRFAVTVDGQPPHLLDASENGEWTEGSAPVWEKNVLRNEAELSVKLPALSPGPHTVRLLYADPGVVFEHLTLTFAGAAPGYPVPPETLGGSRP